MLQNEKCHLLIEHETQKLKELDEEHSLELKEWREKLRPRKKVTKQNWNKRFSGEPFEPSGVATSRAIRGKSNIAVFYLAISWSMIYIMSCCSSYHSWFTQRFLWCDVHVLSLKHSSCCSAWLFSLWNKYLALLPFVATVLRHAFQMIAFCSTSEIQTTPDVAMFVPVWKDKHWVEHFPVGRNKTQWILCRQLNICMATYTQYLQWRHFNHRSWKNSRCVDSIYRPALHVTSNNVFRKDLKVWTVRRITSVRWPHSLPEAHYTKETEAFPCVCALQALEEEFARKLQEQEVFFKMSGESECLNPSTQTRISKFYPIPSVQSTGF